MIAIVDYGVGNLGSVSSMLGKIGAEFTVTSSPEILLQAERIILPGVGHFDKAVSELRTRGLLECLHEAGLQRRRKVLGICLGAQLLGQSSEEGQLPGLGWLDMEVKKFDPAKARVPHMGWNLVTPHRPELFGTTPDQRFYFVHSYYMSCRDPLDVLATSHHGQDFACAVHRDNIYGVQFHPEKSHRFGLQLLRNFLDV